MQQPDKALAGSIAAAYPRVSRETAIVWARSLLRRREQPSLELCQEAALVAAETMDTLSLHRLHRALDQVQRPEPVELLQLPARVPIEGPELARRARAEIAKLARKMGKR